MTVPKCTAMINVGCRNEIISIENCEKQELRVKLCKNLRTTSLGPKKLLVLIFKKSVYAWLESVVALDSELLKIQNSPAKRFF